MYILTLNITLSTIFLNVDRWIDRYDKYLKLNNDLISEKDI